MSNSHRVFDAMVALAAAVAAITCTALSGCATFSEDAGLSAVEQSTRGHLGNAVMPTRGSAADERIAELLAKPLSPDGAVQFALLNNKGLQASFNELGIDEADLVQAGRLSNPGFSFGRLTRAGEVEIDRGVQFNLMRLLTMPLSTRMQARSFEAAQRDVALQVIHLANRTRKAYFVAVAAEQSTRYMRQVQRSADASAVLAQQMAAAGNWNKLSQAREEGFRADAAVTLARAAQAQLAARERLTKLLGATGAQTKFRLPERLPDLPELPTDAREADDIEQLAIDQRLDVQAARLRTQQVADDLGLMKATRFINVLDLGLQRNSHSDGSIERGYQVTLELPLFDWGTARVKKAEGIYMQAVNRAAQTAAQAQSEVREAYAAYRSSHELARQYRDEIVPLKKQVSDENLLRYNGMLISVFDLLADARSQIAGVNGAIETLRDFWLASSNLDMALAGPTE